MKDIILAASKGYNWDQLSPWVRSLRNTGYGDDIAVILYDLQAEIVSKLQGYDVQVLSTQTQDSVYNERSFDFYRALLGKTYRYAIITDIRDVWFQSDPTKWLLSNLHKPLLACSESIRYKNEAWNRQNIKSCFPHLAEGYLDKCVHNSGVLAGQMSFVRDLCLAIHLLAKSSRDPVGDQAAFNILLGLEPYKSNVQFVESEAGFACQCGTMADPRKIDGFKPFLLEPQPILGRKGVTTSTGSLFCIVHQYDRVPAWRDYLYGRLKTIP
jgi:hypothetical protein